MMIGPRSTVVRASTACVRKIISRGHFAPDGALDALDGSVAVACFGEDQLGAIIPHR